MILKTSKKLGDKLNIGVITWAFRDKVGEILLTNFIDILEPSSNELFVITGSFHENTIFNKKIHIINIKHVIKKEPTVIKVFRTILMQLRISINLIKISKNIDIVIFFLGMSLTLPIIFTKLLKKKTILITTSSAQKCAEKSYSKMLLGYGGIIFSDISGFLEKINYILSNKIITHSEDSIEQFGLCKYENKISPSGALFVDIHRFYLKSDLRKRNNLAGYVGRLAGEKGIMNFIKAIPLILKEKDNLKFLIGGDGPLLDEIKNELNNKRSYDKVKLTGWIAQENLSNYLNELKLLVIPSYTETGPQIALEAMACGTPVLATSVGHIPTIVKDKETGFIMENNSPECIAENVIRVLNYHDLDRIARNARKLIEDEYTYEAAVERYRKILESM